MAATSPALGRLMFVRTGRTHGVRFVDFYCVTACACTAPVASLDGMLSHGGLACGAYSADVIRNKNVSNFVFQNLVATRQSKI